MWESEFSPGFIYRVHVRLNDATAGGPPPITKVTQPGGVVLGELKLAETPTDGRLITLQPTCP